MGELSELEMGLRRFCFECNHKVLLKIGHLKKNIFLDPDLILVLDELPKKILNLFLGKKIEIDFPESWFIIELLPLGEGIYCNLKKFGNSPTEKQFELDKTQVLAVLRRFLEEVIDKAVAGGYITPEEKDEFLMPMR